MPDAEMHTAGLSPARRVAIVPGAVGGGPEATAVTRELRRLGYDVSIKAENDPSLFEADAVILTDYSGRLALFSRKASEIEPTHRPIILALIREPLLPLDLPVWALRLGNAFTPVRLGFDGKNRLMARLVRPVYSALAIFGLPAQSLRQSGKELQFVFEHSAWLQAGISQGWLSGVGASTMQKRDVLQSWGTRAVFTPYSMDFAPPLTDPQSGPRDIDVLFLGRLSNFRRIGHLRSIASKLRSRGLSVQIHFQGLYGEERAAVLNRTRIILHLPKYRWDTPWLRWYLGAKHGAAIVAETCDRPEPFRPNVDYLEGPIDQLADVITDLASNEHQRAFLVNACRSQIAKCMDYSDAVERFVTEFLPPASDPDAADRNGAFSG